MPDAPTVTELLATAVAALGGQEREGQVRMAEAVTEAMEGEQHLLVQAGTGTGKSLAYLVPSLLHRDPGQQLPAVPRLGCNAVLEPLVTPF